MCHNFSYAHSLTIKSCSISEPFRFVNESIICWLLIRGRPSSCWCLKQSVGGTEGFNTFGGWNFNPNFIFLKCLSIRNWLRINWIFRFSILVHLRRHHLQVRHRFGLYDRVVSSADGRAAIRNCNWVRFLRVNTIYSPQVSFHYRSLPIDLLVN